MSRASSKLSHDIPSQGDPPDHASCLSVRYHPCVILFSWRTHPFDPILYRTQKSSFDRPLVEHWDHGNHFAYFRICEDLHSDRLGGKEKRPRRRQGWPANASCRSCGSWSGCGACQSNRARRILLTISFFNVFDVDGWLGVTSRLHALSELCIDFIQEDQILVRYRGPSG